MKKIISLLALLSVIAVSADVWADPSFRSYSFANPGSNSTTCDPGEPTGAAEGDTLIYAAYTGSADGDFSLDGWTELHDANRDPPDEDIALYKLVRGASAPSDTEVAYSGSGSNRISCLILAYQDSDDLDVTFVAGSHFTADANTPTAAASPITTNTDNAKVVAIQAMSNTIDGAAGPPSNMTERVNELESGQDTGFYVADATQATAGTFTPNAFTHNDSGSGADPDPATWTVAIKEAPTTATFSSGPTIEAATDGFTVSGTVTGENATVRAVACFPGDADATGAQIIAGDCAGDDNAEFTGSEAWTADAADSFTFTGTDPLARYKVCVIADGASGDSPVTCSTLNRSADSGQAITTLTTPSATAFFVNPTDATGDTDHDGSNPQQITGMTDTDDFAVGMSVTVSAGFATTGPYVITALTATSIDLDVDATSTQSNITVTAEDYFDPDVASGDVLEGDTTVSCSAGTDTITVDTDGDLSYTATTCGETLTSWDYSAQDVTDTTDGLFTSPTDGDFATDDTVYFFNTAPVCELEEEARLIVLTEDEAMSAEDTSTYVSDIDAHGITYSLATQSGSQPAGTSLNSGTGVFSGTPTTEDETGISYVVKATDVGGLSCTFAYDVYVINTWTVPDGTGDTVANWINAIDSAAPWLEGDITVSTSGACSTTVSVNDIISQTPTESSEASAFPSFSAVISIGETTPNCEPRPGGKKKAVIRGVSIGD